MLRFKRLEEIRTANCRNADLRKVNVTHDDFYLVDLRDAQLDPSQRDRALQTGGNFGGLRDVTRRRVVVIESPIVQPTPKRHTVAHD